MNPFLWNCEVQLKLNRLDASASKSKQFATCPKQCIEGKYKL